MAKGGAYGSGPGTFALPEMVVPACRSRSQPSLFLVLFVGKRPSSI